MKKNRPGKISEFILKLFSQSEEQFSVLGDFSEIFNEISKREGKTSAYIWYWKQIIFSLPLFFKYHSIWGITMFTSYFKTSIRNFWKNKVHTFISLVGIAISFAACFFILQYISFEVSYDRFHKNGSDIYRLTNDRYQDGKLIQHGVITYPSVVKQMKADYPEVRNYTRLIRIARMVCNVDQKSFEEDFLFADSAFLSMFSFRLLDGDSKTALAEPKSIVLSEEIAIKYFGNDWRKEGVVGKVFNVDRNNVMKITGVLENPPANSHMDFDILASYSTLKQYSERYEDSWTNSNFMAYLQLAAGSSPAQLEEKFEGFSNKYFKGQEVTGYEEKFHLQPLYDVHLKSDYEYETWLHGNNNAVVILFIIAGIILIIAWVNYINLSTASSLERAKEVGIRKVIGAQKNQLVKQFLTESFFINILGLLIAVMLLFSFQEKLSEYFNLSLSTSLFSNNYGILFIIIFVLGVIVSGLYPAVITASYNSLDVMTGKFKNSTKGRILRKALVVFQFALSTVMIAGAFAVYRQIDFMMNEDLGMEIEQTLVVEGPVIASWDSTFFNKIGEIKSDFMQLASVSSAATSGRLPGRGTGRIFNIDIESDNTDKKYTTSDISVDYKFFETFGMDILAGRGFEFTDHNVDWRKVNKVVINETAARLFGFNENSDAIQKTINFWGRDWIIKGVVEDHHQQSLHEPVQPVVFTPFFSTGSYYFLKVNENNVASTVEEVGKIYSLFFPGNIYNYFFLDDYFNEQYQADENFKSVLSAFAFLGIFLASLGLFGLSYFMTLQRTKEIGIRKVVGASSMKIVKMLINDFLRLVLLSFLMAVPVTLIVINQWLESYSYRISPDWSLFLIPGILVLAIATFTVGLQTLKAANANPVNSLKYE